MANLLSNTKLGANAVISADTMSLDFIVSAPWDNTNNVSILTAYNSNNNLTWSSSGTRIVTLTSSPIYIPPTYSVTVPSSINEGSAGTINVATTLVPDSTTLYYTLTNSSDFSVSSGSFTINSNSGSFNVTPTADNTTEGSETFQVEIRIGSTSGTIVTTSNSITINDTSTSPASWSSPASDAKLLASDAESSDSFGRSVSISSNGTIAIVGAPNEDTGFTNAGAAYIYTRSGTSWTQQAKIQALDKAAYDAFGFSVSIDSDGDTAIVGAYSEDASGITDTGSAYIFIRSGSTWTQQGKITASDKADSDYFGRSVSISGDGNTVVVGAHLEDPIGS